MYGNLNFVLPQLICIGAASLEPGFEPPPVPMEPSIQIPSVQQEVPQPGPNTIYPIFTFPPAFDSSLFPPQYPSAPMNPPGLFGMPSPFFLPHSPTPFLYPTQAPPQNLSYPLSPPIANYDQVFSDPTFLVPNHIGPMLAVPPVGLQGSIPPTPAYYVTPPFPPPLQYVVPVQLPTPEVSAPGDDFPKERHTFQGLRRKIFPKPPPKKDSHHSRFPLLTGRLKKSRPHYEKQRVPQEQDKGSNRGDDTPTTPRTRMKSTSWLRNLVF